MPFWAAAVVFAVCATGGVSGPGVAWTLLPLGAGAVLGRSTRASIAWTVGAALLAVVADLAAVAAEAPEGLALAATAVAATALTAWSWLSGREKLSVQVSVPPVADTTEADRARGLAIELEAARGEVAEAQAERDRAEEARLAAEAATQAKSRFLAAMSHELRTPLNAVMGFADIMRNRLFGPLPDRYAEYSQLIHESGAHLLDLINDVLDLSKIEADKYRLERETFDARDAAGSVLKLMRVQAEEAGVELREVLPERPVPVEADKRAFKQIALNLMSNALKFTPAGGTVTLSLEAVGDALEMTVADTGIGIAPEDLERLGRPYEQAGEADTRALGTGLGLSLVRAFAGLHDGTMHIESALGEGTAVTVRLPVLAPETEMFTERGESAQVIPFQLR
jgi:signal transduction histidine kinase